MIKNVWTIYKEDLKRIFTNYAALIVILALCILPSLYAWFNIKASWDPYGQEATSQIKIGVINNDKGTEFNGKLINIGDQVVDQLKENDLMVLLDDRTKEILEYKLKYPDTSMDELAKIVSLETDKSITKSGINHHFRKLNEIVKKHKEK